MEDNKDIPGGEPIAKMYQRLKEERESVVPTLGEDSYYYHEIRDKPDDFILLITQTLQDRKLNVLIQPNIKEHKLGGYYLTGRMDVWLDKEARGWLNQIKSSPEVRVLQKAYSRTNPADVDECRWDDQTKKRVKALYWEKEKDFTESEIQILTGNTNIDQEKLKKIQIRNQTANSNLGKLREEGIEPLSLDEVRGLVMEAVDEELKSEKDPLYWS